MTEQRTSSVVNAIEDDIIFGILSPGTRLTEDGLMARFGVTQSKSLRLDGSCLGSRWGT